MAPPIRRSGAPNNKKIDSELHTLRINHAISISKLNNINDNLLTWAAPFPPRLSKENGFLLKHWLKRGRCDD